MKKKIEVLKEKIIRGTTTALDVDLVNEISEYIFSLEKQIKELPDLAMMEPDCEIEKNTADMITMNIYINK